MTKRAKGRALVTGGTRGIGAAVAAELRSAGFAVIVTGTAPGGKAPAGCGYLACDLGEEAQLSSLESLIRTRGISVLVNNAGINKVGPAEGYDAREWARIQKVNVEAPFRLAAAVLPGMRARGWGRIVNIGSIYGLVSRAGRSAYSASKSALGGLSRALALEAAADGVLVNCVAPGFVATDLTRRVLGVRGMREMARQVPLGRLARPAEIARFVRFLASGENTYMTGQTVVVDGGFTSA